MVLVHVYVKISFLDIFLGIYYHQPVIVMKTAAMHLDTSMEMVEPASHNSNPFLLCRF